MRNSIRAGFLVLLACLFVPLAWAAPRPVVVATDDGLLAILSNVKALTAMNQMVSRFGGVLQKVEKLDVKPGGSTYRFHYGRREPSPLHHGVGHFDVKVGYGAQMKPNVGEVGQPVLMR
ncbi:MAG: hypothetical protein HY816_05250 [Candidatus Wallbacteria bacterium]|nr:hypothetical protein [Candidatus Wallbacteria bacterium]